MKKLHLIIFLLAVNFAFSSDIKFGKVSEEEVMEEMHPLENDAEAAILHKSEFITYDYNYEEGWFVQKEIHYRIKIYSKEGFSWATMQVPLYRDNQGREKISGIKGYTFNMVDGKLVSEKLKKDGIFEEEVNEFRIKSSITMPEVKEGSVLDIQYKISSPLFWYMSEFTFQYGIPVNSVDITLKVPEYFVFQKHTKGFYPIQFNERTANRKMDVSYRTNEQARGLYTRSSAASLARTQRRTANLEFKENIYDITASNLPSMKEEEYTDNINNYRSAIKFELSSTQFPNSPYKFYTKSWADVAKSIYQYSSFGTELKKTNYFEKDLAALLEGVTTDGEKVAKIYHYVKSKMTWNGIYSVGCRKGVKDAYKEKSGNVAEINLMLTSMLRFAGINANPVLVSTKSHGIPLFPTTEGFNYVVTGIEVPDDVILLDATDKYGFPDVLPERALNWFGRLIRKDGSSSNVQMVPSALSKRTLMTSVSVNESGDVTGKTRMQRTGQFALAFRNEHNGSDEELYLENLENQYGGIEISEYELKNKASLAKPVIEVCEFYKEAQCEVVGDKIYLKPMMFYAVTENPFKIDKRDYPINFSFPRENRYMINIKIPEGYKIESVPENKSLQLPQNMGTFKYMIKNSGNNLQLVVSSEIKTAVIPPNYYSLIKEYYNQVIEKEAERVVLSKT